MYRDPPKRAPKREIKPAEVALREILARSEGKLPGDVAIPRADCFGIEEAVKVLRRAVCVEMGREAQAREVSIVEDAIALGELAEGSLEIAWKHHHKPPDDVLPGPRMAALVLFLSPFIVEEVRFHSRTGLFPDVVAVTPPLAEALRKWEATRLVPRGLVVGMPWIVKEVLPAKASALTVPRTAFWAGDFLVGFARQKAPDAAEALRTDRPVDLTRGLKPQRRRRLPGLAKLEG